MFITLTIDTHRKKASAVMMKRRKINPSNGWRTTINRKRRNMWLRVRDWKKSLKRGQYRLAKIGSQVTMF